MPALNFYARFAPGVEDGSKTTSIRARRKDGRDPRPGQTLYLYTGMRQSGCRKLREAVCESARDIEIDTDGSVTISNRRLPPAEKELLATGDGFKNFDEMYDWFREKRGLPFDALLIRWGKAR